MRRKEISLKKKFNRFESTRIKGVFEKIIYRIFIDMSNA